MSRFHDIRHPDTGEVICRYDPEADLLQFKRGGKAPMPPVPRERLMDAIKAADCRPVDSTPER